LEASKPGPEAGPLAKGAAVLQAQPDTRARLDALITLLVEKGLITRDELGTIRKG
jgi:hypothetical protein